MGSCSISLAMAVRGCWEAEERKTVNAGTRRSSTPLHLFLSEIISLQCRVGVCLPPRGSAWCTQVPPSLAPALWAVAERAEAPCFSGLLSGLSHTVTLESPTSSVHPPSPPALRPARAVPAHLHLHSSPADTSSVLFLDSIYVH